MGTHAAPARGVALSVALWLAGLIAMTACGQPAGTPSTTADTTQVTTTTEAPTVATTTSMPPTTTTEPPTTVPPPAAATHSASSFVAPFTLTAPLAWSFREADPKYVQIFNQDDAELSQFLIFTAFGSDQASWANLLSTNPHLDTVGVGNALVGGIEATVYDVRVLPGATNTGCTSNATCVLLTTDPVTSIGHAVREGLPNRIWLVDSNGVTVAIIAEAPEEDFEVWVGEVEAVLGTLVWE